MGFVNISLNTISIFYGSLVSIEYSEPRIDRPLNKRSLASNEVLFNPRFIPYKLLVKIHRIQRAPKRSTSALTSTDMAFRGSFYVIFPNNFYRNQDNFSAHPHPQTIQDSTFYRVRWSRVFFYKLFASRAKDRGSNPGRAT